MPNGIEDLPIEIGPTPLGRMLAMQWTLGAIIAVSALVDETKNGDDFASCFFAKVARAVGEDEPLTAETFDAGQPISVQQISSLANTDRDALATAYLDSSPDLQSPPGVGEPETETLEQHEGTSKRPVDILRAAVLRSISGIRESNKIDLARFNLPNKALVSEAMKGLATLTAALRGADFQRISHPMAEFKTAFAALNGASELIRNQLSHLPITDLQRVKEAIGNTKVELVDTARIDPLNFRPPPNPVYETNQRLNDVREDLGQLVEVAQWQASLTQALSDVARDTLQQSITYGHEAKEATRQARTGVRVAIAALVVTTIASAAATWIGRVDASDTARQVASLAAAQSATVQQTGILKATIADREHSDRQLFERIDALIRTESVLSRQIEIVAARPARQSRSQSR